MNLLTDTLPKAVRSDGIIYPVRWDFCTGLKIMQVFEDPELAVCEKQALLLELLYCDKIPPDTGQAIRLAVRFLNCGESAEALEEPVVSAPRLYSFTKDSNYIFTAINQTHGVDLERSKDLHWWKFCFLFSDIGEDCFFSRLLYLRRQAFRGKLTKEEREWYNSIREIAELEGNPADGDENLEIFLSQLAQADKREC